MAATANRGPREPIVFPHGMGGDGPEHVQKEHSTCDLVPEPLDVATRVVLIGDSAADSLARIHFDVDWKLYRL